MVRDNPDAHLDLIAKAFKWTQARRRRASWPRCTSRTCRRTSRSSRGRSTRRAASAASSSRPSTPTADLIKDPADADRFVELEAPEGARGRRRRSRTRRRRSRRSDRGGAPPSKAIRCSARTSGSCSAELVEPRHQERGQPEEPRGDQEAPAGQPGLDRAPARPRGQLDDRGIPQAGRRAVRARSRRFGAMELSKKRAAEITRLLIEKHGVAKERHRDGRPRLGGAARHGLGPEPPRRGRSGSRWSSHDRSPPPTTSTRSASSSAS